MFQILTRSDVFLRGLKMASIVEIILAAINHAYYLLLGKMTFTNWVKVLITFCIPFLCFKNFICTCHKKRTKYLTLEN